MIHTIENEYFKVKISTKGAELQSVYSKKLNVELLWQGDAAYWGKRSPVLFPIVGSLKEGKYVYNEKEYSLSRHGFARDMEFTHQTSTINSIANFELVNTINTIENFPFEFSLKISYALLGESLMAMYQIQNTSKSENLFASVGVHPAFNVPLFQNTTFEDYFLQFNQDENSNIYPLTVDGLIKNSSVPFFKGNNEIKLEKSLFYTDALVFKDLKSNNIKFPPVKGNSTIFDLYITVEHENKVFTFKDWWLKVSEWVQLEYKVTENVKFVTVPTNETVSVWEIMDKLLDVG